MIPVEDCYNDWKKSLFPGHLLYGLTHLHNYGITPIYHTIPFNPYAGRLRLALYNLKVILFAQQPFDAIYAVTHNGLELLIFLRALRLYKKPIVVWHHSAIVVPENKFRKFISMIFYKGIDKAFFFSQPLLDASVKTGKISRESAHLIHWGADISFYDLLIKNRAKSSVFISTGRERRDFITLIRAFNQTAASCNIYTTAEGGFGIDYTTLLSQESINPNIRLSIVNAKHIELAKIANDAYAILISCLNYPYTLGLTSLVEAMALGLPVITTDNPYYPIDVEKENIGIKVPHGDVEAWVKAILFLSAHPDQANEMGDNGRRLAEKQYNLNLFTEEIASILLTIIK
jgi:glycosyltransferase involved in cell wall biosynthesis